MGCAGRHRCGRRVDPRDPRRARPRFPGHRGCVGGGRPAGVPGAAADDRGDGGHAGGGLRHHRSAGDLASRYGRWLGIGLRGTGRGRDRSRRTDDGGPFGQRRVRSRRHQGAGRGRPGRRRCAGARPSRRRRSGRVHRADRRRRLGAHPGRGDHGPSRGPLRAVGCAGGCRVSARRGRGRRHRDREIHRAARQCRAVHDDVGRGPGRHRVGRRLHQAASPVRPPDRHLPSREPAGGRLLSPVPSRR